MKPLAADDPRVIGEYRLRAQLGAGGMGRVYLGLSPAGRAVAIKVVHPDLASDAAFLRRFGQEVAAARAVSGIYTAPVVASGLAERPPWLATAFVPGPSLDQMVTEHGPLPEQALWPLLGGLVEALQAIHACGVVHRDLKPANVLLAADGPRVIDFGIARAVDGTSLTAAGVVFGTPGYMSPEQAEGRGASPASDVFALGCVVAYAAAGMGPFGTGTAAAILYRVVHAEPVLDGVPPRLREVIAGCLAKDPAARPSLRALSGAIAGGMDATGPSAVAFWPSSVARLIGAYQARLEEETRTRPAAGGGFSWATTAHRPATPSDPGGNRPGPPAQPPVSPSPAPRWPYSPPGGAQAVPQGSVGVQYAQPRGYQPG
ncbi:MAG TPA: serine/threonine-protein kinase, partial [Streptosporangiaceae bacterium]|nr:serine/threonine-protein kinase [Streptosporangiaceae bacterium]